MPASPIKTILLATDLSPRADRALERAASLARHWNAKLHLLSVIDVAAPRDDAGTDEVAAEAEARRKAEESLTGHGDAIVHVLVGQAETAIASLAAEVKADLVVTGPSGSTWLRQTLLGGTLKHLMRHAHVPVLLVRTPVNDSYRRVVVSMDLSDASRAPVDVALDLFGRSASVSVFHAFTAPLRLFSGDIAAYEAGMREGVILEIRDALQAWSAANAETLPIIADYGDPAIQLAELVAKHRIELVVAGTHGRTGLMNLLLGSVVESIVEKVGCDVLIAPSRGAWI